MTRPIRYRKPNTTYHTYSRCINQEKMMKDNKIKDMMLIIIQETLNIYNFEFSGFEILDNHFHFIIKTLANGEDISKIMQRIKSVFAKRYNNMHGRKGPLWNERFSSIVIENENQNEVLFFLWRMAYNSSKRKHINDPREYKYSSINCYLDENFIPKVKITLHKAFTDLGSNFQSRVEKFILYEKCCFNGL